MAAVAVPLAVAAPRPVRADDLGMARQAFFLLRTLTYDRNLKSRAGAAAAIVIVYKQGLPESEASARDLATAIDELAATTTLLGLPIRRTSRRYTDSDALEAMVTASHAVAVYVCPGLDDRIAEIAKVTRMHSALSMTRNDAWVAQGLSVAFVMREDRPTIVVSLPHARMEGASLDPALLRFAEVIR